LARIAEVIGLLDQGIFVGIPINGASNFAQGVTALNSVAGHGRGGMAVSCQQLLDGPLKALAFPLGTSQSSLINRIVEISRNVLLSHNLPPAKRVVR
jgi:hypothetical protein